MVIGPHLPHMFGFTEAVRNLVATEFVNLEFKLQALTGAEYSGAHAFAVSNIAHRGQKFKDQLDVCVRVDDALGANQGARRIRTSRRGWRNSLRAGH